MGGHDFIQERKEELMDGWLYGGVVPAGEKKLGDVAELLLGNPDDDDGIKRERERERVFTVLYRLMIWQYIRADTPRAIITRPRTLTG